MSGVTELVMPVCTHRHAPHVLHASQHDSMRVTYLLLHIWGQLRGCHEVGKDVVLLHHIRHPGLIACGWLCHVVVALCYGCSQAILSVSHTLQAQQQAVRNSCWQSARPLRGTPLRYGVPIHSCLLLSTTSPRFLPGMAQLQLAGASVQDVSLSLSRHMCSNS